MLEDRRITFEPTELYHAIYAHCKRANQKTPPSGEIESVSFKDKAADSTDIVNIKLVDKNERTSVDLKYGEAFVAAALIMYCRGVGVPVPKAAKKSIEITSNRIVLRAVM